MKIAIVNFFLTPLQCPKKLLRGPLLGAFITFFEALQSGVEKIQRRI